MARIVDASVAAGTTITSKPTRSKAAGNVVLEAEIDRHNRRTISAMPPDTGTQF
jgi:hypothetical protein